MAFCSKCGAQVATDAAFCGICGQAVLISTKSEITQPSVQVISELDDASKIFVGKDYDYYLRKWEIAEQKKSKNSWNLFAFLFGFAWMAYRKMYLYSLIFIGVIAVEILCEYAFDFPDRFTNAINITIPVITGFLGNSWYKYHVKKKFKEITANTLNSPEKVKIELIRQGGTSIGAAIGFIAIFIAVAVIAIAIINNNKQLANNESIDGQSVENTVKTTSVQAEYLAQEKLKQQTEDAEREAEKKAEATAREQKRAMADFPECGSNAAEKDVAHALEKAPMGRIRGLSLIKIKDAKQVNATVTSRDCTGIAHLNNGEIHPMTYRFYRDDKDIMIEAEILHSSVENTAQTTSIQTKSPINELAKTSAQPEPKQVVVTEQPEPQAEQVQQTPSEPATTTEQNKTWVGDWGNGIIATVSSQPCGNNELINQSYNYLMFVSIPKSRLKTPDDAWQVLGNRAVTITGCWIKNPDSMIHAKLNKKNGKTWEQDFKMTDGNWTEKGSSDSTNEPAKQLSSSPLDEANTKINTVWNGTTKEVRAALLPEQRGWLKQRESDCSLVAEKINCMVTMTDLRTEILKQKIAVLEKKS
jgi:uncharacterized protein YecT (DUF1311 family)